MFLRLVGVEKFSIDKSPTHVPFRTFLVGVAITEQSEKLKKYKII